MKLEGVFVPLVTPFNFEGELYRAKVAHNLSKLNLTAVTGYVSCSAIGDAPLLSFEEKTTLFELTAQFAAPEKVKIAAVSEASVREAARLIDVAAAHGFSGALLEAPASFPADTRALWIRAIADRSPVPVIAPLDGHPNVMPVALDMPAAANAVPYAFVTVFEALRSREQEAAEDWRARLEPAIAAVNRYGIAGLKYAMELFSYYGGAPRLPYVPVSPEAQREIAQAFRDLRS